MKINILLFFFISIFLSSCAATNSKSTEPFYDTNGKKTQVVTCSMYSTKNCNKKAGNICKSKGYKVKDKRKEAFSYTTKLYFQCN